MKNKTAAIIPAAGKGTRFGLDINKLLIPVENKTIIEHTVDIFLSDANIDYVIVPVSEDDTEFMAKTLSKRVILAKGGATRTQSVANALEILPADAEIVLIHDGARPFVDHALIDRIISDVKTFRTAVAAIPSTDTVKIVSEGNISSTPQRSSVWLTQTPQGFYVDDIKLAYSKITGSDCFTDDSGVFEKYIGPAHVTMGNISNKKITVMEDLRLFNKSKPEYSLRVGTGYDAHRLTENRALILGGVQIPYEKGLLGHSDADVLVHSVMDALLSASCLKDIGALFPDTDPQYKDISSLLLLKKVGQLMVENGKTIINVSAAIICQAPKLAPYIELMRENIAATLNIPVSQVNISATTTEGMGFAGRGEGIAASSTCLITG